MTTGTDSPVGRTVPGWSIRVVFGAIALLLCVTGSVSGFWLLVALLLAAAAVSIPRWLTAWFLIAMLALTVLLAPTGANPLHVLLLIAGAHALHLCAMWMLVVPAAVRLQPAALFPTVRRFVAIQLPVQLLAAAALWWAHPAGWPPVAPVAAVAGVAILALVALLAAPLVRGPRG
jgi:hypothetical protein